MDEVEEWISEVEEKAMKITWMEQKSFYSDDILRELWGNMKWKNIALYWSQKEKREKKSEKLFEEIMAENFLNMGNEIASRSRKHTEPQTKWIPWEADQITLKLNGKS